MKHVKHFEDINTKPEVGDYVFCQTSLPEAKEFFDNHIGKISYIDDYYDDENDSLEKYHINFGVLLPRLVKNVFATVDLAPNLVTLASFEIIHFAKTKEEIETKISANKYNI